MTEPIEILLDDDFNVIPQVVSTGHVRFLGRTLVVHVLDDGRRIVDADSLVAVTEMLHGEATTQGEKDALSAFLRGNGRPPSASVTEEPSR